MSGAGPIRPSGRRLERLADHWLAIAEFKNHEVTLAAAATVFLAGALISTWLLVPAALCIQAGATYALRFKRTGCRFMTRRSLWIGATPADVASRHLLGDWKP